MKNVITVKPPTKTELLTLRLMIFLGLAAMWVFLKTMLSPEIRGNGPLYYLLMVTFVFTCLKILHEWIHYFYIRVPETPATTRLYTVDIFTTFVAGEPYAMIEETLTALKAIKYPHKTYLCDESNDPYLRALCERLGVYHVTRTLKIDAKAGNINNALRQSDGELCVVLDPDHVPFPEFLDPIVSHFDNPEIGFVQIVQAYKNHKESLIAKGAAQQTYQFYGPMMMTMNKYGTVQAIGANCTFRRTALESIGGHAAGLAEDMHTSMQLHAKGWKSIYVPVVLARGLVPSSLSAYYQQQLKWSRGVFELLVTSYPKLFTQFTWKQKLHYGVIPLHYVSGLISLINLLIPLIALFFNKSPVYISLSDFGFTLLPLMAAIVLIRHFVQWWVMEDEERGFHVVGGLLMIGTWWVFTTGLIYTILRKKVPYVPTPKEGTEDSNWLLNVPNIIVLALSMAAIAYGLVNDWNPYNLAMAGFAATNCLFMIFVIGASRQYQIRRWNNSNAFTTYLFSKIGVFKANFWILRRRVYTGVRKMALIITTMGVGSLAYFKTTGSESGHIADQKNEGPINAPTHRFKITPIGLSWGKKGQFISIFNRVDSVYSSGSVPMLSWAIPEDRTTFSAILSGEYDGYLKVLSDRMRATKRPVYILFPSTGQSADAREYVYGFLKNQQLYNAIYLSTNGTALKFGRSKTQVPDTLFTEPITKNRSAPQAIFADLHGVNYSKGQEWTKKLNVFTKEELETDFSEMKAMHINGIKRYGPGIYDRNVLEVSRQNGFQVHYGFWSPENIDFKKDEKILDEFQEIVSNTIEDLKDHDEIRSWNLGNAVFQKLENRYNGPDLLYQQQAYLLWLKETVLEIKKVDSSRPITIDIDVSPEMPLVVNRIRNVIPEIDAFGLVVGSLVPTAEVLNAMPAPYFISYVVPKNQSRIPAKQALFLSNWQDEKWTDKVSIDGVKDFNGRYKSLTSPLAIKVLKPTEGTFADTELAYHAIVRKNGRWKLASATNEKLQYEWKLVRTDQYENPLAVTDVGVGSSLKLRIPKDPALYQLYLYAVQGNSVKAIIQSTLNTPLATTDK